jgi:hypothetical protein
VAILAPVEEVCECLRHRGLTSEIFLETSTGAAGTVSFGRCGVVLLHDEAPSPCTS